MDVRDVGSYLERAGGDGRHPPPTVQTISAVFFLDVFFQLVKLVDENQGPKINSDFLCLDSFIHLEESNLRY